MFRTTRTLLFLLSLAVPLGLASAALAGPPPAVCGNEIVEDGEQCDDGNVVGGDGCSPTCQFEVCGNETVDPGEQCDDGNTAAGDGCSPNCLFEVCGNGILDPGEQCDDGNTNDGDGCSANCTIESSEPFCGDGNLDPGEQCDDGNNLNGDGCSSDCMIEPDPVCGNGVIEGDEQCDDGNTLDGDGCSASCTIEIAEPSCGNGVIEGDEQCDDGNTLDGDGCSASCTIEIAEPVCGNGAIEGDEQCDDGNLDDGDGCSSECTIEDGDGQNPGQKLCINTMNKRGKDTSKAQSKEVIDCFDTSDPDGCILGDLDGRMAKERAKTQTAKEKKCDPDNLPDFGFVGATATHAAGRGSSIALVADLFGSLNEALSEDKKTSSCQEKVTRESQEVLDKLFRLAGKAKRKALDEGASSAIALQTAIVALIDSDGGKFDRWAHYQISKSLDKSCGKVDLAKAFPGCAPDAPAVALARGLEIDGIKDEGVTKCAVDSTRCRWCEAYNLMDGLTIDCDAFDDGSANGSCLPLELPDDDKDDED